MKKIIANISGGLVRVSWKTRMQSWSGFGQIFFKKRSPVLIEFSRNVGTFVLLNLENRMGRKISHFNYNYGKARINYCVYYITKSKIAVFSKIFETFAAWCTWPYLNQVSCFLSRYSWLFGIEYQNFQWTWCTILFSLKITLPNLKCQKRSRWCFIFAGLDKIDSDTRGIHLDNVLIVQIGLNGHIIDCNLFKSSLLGNSVFILMLGQF